MKWADFESEGDQPSVHLSARQSARRCALQGTYAWLMMASPVDDLIAATVEQVAFAHADKKYLKVLLEGITLYAADIDAAIEPYLDRDVKRLSIVEHAVLLVGGYELIYQTDVPYRVVVNEAVELSKAFGATEGFRYINGVLDKLAKAVRPHEINKR